MRSFIVSCFLFLLAISLCCLYDAEAVHHHQHQSPHHSNQHNALTTTQQNTQHDDDTIIVSLNRAYHMTIAEIFTRVVGLVIVSTWVVHSENYPDIYPFTWFLAIHYWLTFCVVEWDAVLDSLFVKLFGEGAILRLYHTPSILIPSWIPRLSLCLRFHLDALSQKNRDVINSFRNIASNLYYGLKIVNFVLKPSTFIQFQRSTLSVSDDDDHHTTIADTIMDSDESKNTSSNMIVWLSIGIPAFLLMIVLIVFLIIRRPQAISY